MKTGAENRKKTVLLGILIAVALGGILYNLFSVFGGSSTPPPSVAPVTTTPTRTTPLATAAATRNNAVVGAGAVPGVAAQKLASSSSSLDPTLDESAMLRAESLVYSGSGRNIFSAIYTPAVLEVPKHMPPARPVARGPIAPPVPTGPPPPPPIPLKFFGTAQRRNGPRQAFLLSGDDVYLASTGDIVAKRYKVDQIMSFGVQVTDLLNNNTQTLPLQQQ